MISSKEVQRPEVNPSNYARLTVGRGWGVGGGGISSGREGEQGWEWEVEYDQEKMMYMNGSVVMKLLFCVLKIINEI